MLWRIAIGLIVLGIALNVFGITELRLRAGASDQPQAITLQQLIDRGPEGNPHVLVSGLSYCEDFVYEYEGNENRWNCVWIPVVPAGQAPLALPELPRLPFGGNQPLVLQGRPSQIRAIVMTGKVRNQNDFNSFRNQPAVKGMVTNLVQSVSGERKKLLDEGYPGTDWSRCIIIQEGRGPWSMTSILAMMGVGLLLFFGGIGLFIAGWRADHRKPAPRRRPERGLPEVLPADYDEQDRQASAG
jgi:hypothetical protein